MKIYKWLSLTSLLIILSLVWFLLFDGIPAYFTPQVSRPSAEILVVEGWLGRTQLTIAKNLYEDGNYEKLITTGARQPDYFRMGRNGTMEFSVHSSPRETQNYEIILNCKGSLEKGLESKYKLSLNDSLFIEDSVHNLSTEKKYLIAAYDTLRKVTIRFTNDALIVGKDRNLLVNSIEINKQTFFANDTNVVYQIEDGSDTIRMRLGPTTAVFARNWLIECGLDPEFVQSVNTPDAGFSRTTETVKEAVEYISSAYPKGFKITLVSQSPHSRRTFEAYKKLLGNENVGVISLPDRKKPKYLERKIELVRELLGILYIKLFLKP